MRVTVRLFARLRDVAGTEHCDVNVPAGASVDDVWRETSTRFPALAPFEPVVSAAVNAEFARRRSPVHDGDEVAFLPPVSGGARHLS